MHILGIDFQDSLSATNHRFQLDSTGEVAVKSDLSVFIGVAEHQGSEHACVQSVA